MKNITFINAGAGSGKTFQLTKILGNWIQEGNKANQVLITTFTKKAAGEIKERVQAKLLEDHNFEAVNAIKEAAIGTVHSIGYQFIKKYWYLLDISPGLNEISDIEKDILFSQAIADVPTHKELDELNRLNYALDFKKSNNGRFSTYNPFQWRDDVLDLMKQCLLNTINLDHPDSLEVSLKKVNKLFKGDKNETNINAVFSTFYLLINEVKSLRVKNIIPKSDKIESRLKELELLFKESYSIKNILSLSKILKDFTSLSNDKFFLSCIDNSSLDFKPQDFDVFRKTNQDYIKLIFDLAKRSLQKYEAFKQQNGLVDYTDMEVNFLKLLEFDIVKKEVQSTIKLIMVDEFQDSNPIQLSIFMKLSALVKKSYWVGDPKQAIYGFRGTDPVLIDAIIKEFTKKNEKDLDIELLKMSWRSTPQLVNFTNAIFEERFLEQTSDIELNDANQIHGDINNTEFNTWKSSVNIKPLQAKDSIGLIPARNTSQELTKNALKFWSFVTPTDKGGKAMPQALYHEKLAYKIKEIIAKGNAGDYKVIDKDSGLSRNLRGSDICILTGSNNKVADIAKCFKDINIEVNASLTGLLDTVEYRLIQNIITLFIDEKNALSISELNYLCGDASSVNEVIEERLNFILPLLEEQKKDKDFKLFNALPSWFKDSKNLELILELKKQSSYLSVSHILHKIINQFNIYQKLFSFTSSQLRQDNTSKIIDLAKSYESYCLRINTGSSLVGFLNFMTLSNEHDKQSVSENLSAVNVMTYHKSKGLEWPMVFLSNLQKDFSSNFIKKEYFKTKIKSADNFSVYEPLKNRSVEFSFWPFGSAVSVNQDLESEITASNSYLALEKAKLNEASRVLYVGITRARDYCVFSTNQVKKLPWLESIFPNWSYEDAFNNFDCATTVNETIDMFDLGKAAMVDFECILPDTTFSNLDTPEDVPLYFNKQVPLAQNSPYHVKPSQVKPLKNVTLGDVLEIHPRQLTVSNNATLIGNTLHQLLYLKDKTYLEKVCLEMQLLQEVVKDTSCFIENTKVFNLFLNKTFNPIKQYPEYAMEQKIGAELVTGEADLVLEQEDGLILIDYKSFPGDKKDITEVSSQFHASKYSGQLSVYSKMLEKSFNKPVKGKYIYYAVQGLFVELKF